MTPAQVETVKATAQMLIDKDAEIDLWKRRLATSEELRDGLVKALNNTRDAFLNMIADAVEWEDQPDGDVNDSGRMIDCTTFVIRTGTRQLEELSDALGIRRGTMQSLKDAIDEAVQAPVT